MANKRVIDLPDLSQEVQEGQYVLVDSVGGTGKMDLKHIVDEAGSFDPAGEYPELFAGNLTTDKAQEDKIPYLFRKTAGNLSRVGERCYDTIVGASVGENQLVDYDTLTVTGGTVSVQGSVAEYTITTITENIYTNGIGALYTPIIGHKYYIGAYITLPHTPSANRFNLYIGGQYKFFTPQANVKTWCEALASTTATNTPQVHVAPYANDGYVVGDKCKVEKWTIIDLSLYLPANIVDYIYTLESATAGSGIAKLRSWGFLRGYQAFNAGSIESVEVTGKKARGFNAWDEEWEVGYINPTTGEATSANDRIRTKNFNPCLPNTAYYVKDPTSSNNVRIFYYDADKNFVSETGWKGNQILTTPSNAYFFKFIMSASYGTTYNNDICINLSSSRNGEYEAYTSQTYALGSDKLRGIFKLDSNNNLYAEGDVKTSDGLITRKYGVVDLGTLNYSSNWGAGTYDVSGVLSNANAIIAKYSYVSGVNSTNMPDKAWTYASNRLFIKDTAYNSTSAFKTAMSGVMLVCELATPTTEQGDPFPSPQVCYPDGTEEYITESGVPVGHETEYPYDLKGLVEELIDVPDVPSANGTYVLKATRSASGVAYNWVTG